MYAVVGCRNCGALWVVEGRPETTGCPRCGTTRQFGKLRKFAKTEDADAARQARAALLAERQGEDEAFGEVPDFATLETAVDGDVVTDEEFLTGSGLDAGAIEAAGERAERGRNGGTSGDSAREVVLAAVDALEEPTASAVVEQAAEAGLGDGEQVRSILEKLTRDGELARNGGTYRRV